MSQEPEEQALVTAHLLDARGSHLNGRLDGVVAAVGQRTALQVAPQTLDRIELRRARKEAFDGQPGPRRLEVRVA